MAIAWIWQAFIFNIQQIHFCEVHIILLYLQCGVFSTIAFSFPHSSPLFLQALLKFQFPHAIQLPKEGSSIITSDSLSHLRVYRNAINTSAEAPCCCSADNPLSFFMLQVTALTYLLPLLLYTSLKETELVPWMGTVLTDWPVMISVIMCFPKLWWIALARVRHALYSSLVSTEWYSSVWYGMERFRMAPLDLACISTADCTLVGGAVLPCEKYAYFNCINQQKFMRIL